MESSSKKQKTLTSFFKVGTTAPKHVPLSTDSAELVTPSVSTKGVSSCSDFQNEGRPNSNNIESTDSLPSESEPFLSSGNEWPSVWTLEMWQQKKEAFPWLDCKEGKLGCSICKNISNLGAFKTERSSISNEWRSYSITFNGKTKTAQLTSLRKKIFDHKSSSSHKAAEKIAEVARSETIEKVVDTMNEKHLETTKTVFRTAYYIAKNNRTYSDHFNLLELQNINGIDIGVGLHSRNTAAAIIDHISDEMKRRIIQQIKNISGKISVIIDESTTLGSKSTLIVYLKCEFSKELPPHFLFLDLIELSGQTSEMIVQSLFDCLNQHGFDENYLKENLISFASDGASTMLGKKSGVAGRLLKLYPDIVVWHCMNHKLELAFGDAINEVGSINYFQIFMDKIYSLYSKSPKNQRELAECASALEQEIQKIGKTLGTRWVASSFRAVSSVWYGYSAIYNHFEKAKVDKDRTSTDRATYSGLSKNFSSSQFLLNLAIMYDVLAELSMLSESLQDRNTTIVYADKLIRRSIRFFESLEEKPGTKYLEALVAQNSGNFNNIPLTNNPKLKTINYGQLIRSVINNLNKRMFTTISSHESTSASADTNRQAYDSLLSDLKVLEPDHWPKDKDQSVRYGEVEIDNLCRRFKIELNKSKVINGLRDYIEDSSKIPKDLTPLLNCAKLIPCSSAEAERGFSLMNQIITDERSRLLTKHVSNIMFIKHHGPPVKEWHVELYAKTWLRKHRTADDTRTRHARAKYSKEEVNPFASFV